jgi:hypothetical protein
LRASSFYELYWLDVKKRHEIFFERKNEEKAHDGENCAINKIVIEKVRDKNDFDGLVIVIISYSKISKTSKSYHQDSLVGNENFYCQPSN